MSDIPADDTLSLAQHKAVHALLTEPTIRQAARAAGVDERTLYRWLKDPAFAAVYRSARREATQQALAQLQRQSGEAVKTLVSIMKNARQPAAARIAAAAKVLDLAVKTLELDDFEARLAALEARYAKE